MALARTSYIPITDKPEEIFDIRIDVLYLPIANTDNGQDTEINIQPATENKKKVAYMVDHTNKNVYLTISQVNYQFRQAAPVRHRPAQLSQL